MKKNLILMSLLGVGAGFFLAWYFLDFSNNKEGVSGGPDKKQLVEDVVKKNQGVSELTDANQEVKAVVEKILKYMLLPPGDLTLLTVNDGDVLRQKNPEAFKYVKNGDKLVIYPNGIIIYDAIKDKIVDVIRLTASGTPIQF